MKKCLICNGKWNFSFKGRDNLYKITDEEFEVYTCDRCGLRRILPQLDRQKLASYYPSNYYSYVAHKQKSLLKKLKRFLIMKRWTNMEMYLGLPREFLGNRRFLDVGCGDGEIIDIMNECGWRTVGYEIGTKPGIKNNIYKSRDFAKTNFRQKFDCIRIWSVLEHVSNPREYLEKMHSLLSKNGVMYLCVPNTASINARLFRQYWYGLDVPRHQFGYNLENISLLLNQSGFKILKCSFWDNFFFNSLGYVFSKEFPMILSLLSAIFYKGDTLALKIAKK